MHEGTSHNPHIAGFKCSMPKIRDISKKRDSFRIPKERRI